MQRTFALFLVWLALAGSGRAQEEEMAPIFRKPPVVEERVTLGADPMGGLRATRTREMSAEVPGPEGESGSERGPMENPAVPEGPGDGQAPAAPEAQGSPADRVNTSRPQSPLSDILGGILPEPPAAGKKQTGPGFQAGWQTVQGARILTLSIPAPRGQIVDRNGEPLAQNVVVHYVGVNFPFMDEEGDEAKIAYARERLDKANALTGKAWTLKDEDILEHYRNRRWLPLIFNRLPLAADDHKKLEQVAGRGIVLLPTYQRVYPQQQVAGHIVGYVGRRPPWPKGEIPDGEQMWPVPQGVLGLERSFDRELTGVDGRVQIIFNERGERVEEKLIRSPVPGQNVVTSLDLEMQQLAEQITARHVRRGAFVIIEVQTGDVLAMASYPQYDPNEFIPFISADRFNALNGNPDKPLLGRAFQGSYPPASTFKVFSALGMLHAGTISESSIYDCPSSFTIGDRIARNWNQSSEGGMNVIGALARSCNTWFFQGAMVTDAPYITGMAQEFGLGRKTGVPIEESAGLIPTNEWWLQKFKSKIGKGDLCNIVIGQGSVETTPLQVAQSMAALANRRSLVQARLVLQVQDYLENITNPFDVVPRELHVPDRNLQVVHRGMFEVVNGDRGTGRNARHDRINISGKTGTGQWVPAKSQNIAWFAGFAPSEYPVYAFAAVYEGEPGETIGGGSKAAPIIGDFFKEYLDDPRLVALQELSSDIRVREAGEVVLLDDPALRAIYHGGPSTDPLGNLSRPPAAEEPRKKQNLFQSLFGPKRPRP